MKTIYRVVILLFSVIMVSSSLAKESYTSDLNDRLFITPIRSYNPESLKGIPVPLPHDADGVTGDDEVGGFSSPAAVGGTDPGTGTAAAELPPNLRVDFILQSLENVIVDNGGADHVDPLPLPANITYVFWDWNAPIATDEYYDVLVALPMPSPGEESFTYGMHIYGGLVVDGCGNTPFFPITLDSWVEEDGVEIGTFSATDNTTIQPNGYWNFSYKMRVTDANGGISDIKAKGIVSALCTNIAPADFRPGA